MPSLVIKQPFRDVVIDGKARKIKLTDVDLDTLRDAIDKNEIVRFADVMNGMARLMHYPFHTTKYDMKLFTKEPFIVLSKSIDNGETPAYTKPGNSHIYDERYVRTQDLLNAFDGQFMPCPSTDFVWYSKHTANKPNEDRLYPRDFRRAFLVAIGNASPHRASYKNNELVDYVPRTEEEWNEYDEHKKKSQQKMKPCSYDLMVERLDEFIHKIWPNHNNDDDDQPSLK